MNPELPRALKYIGIMFVHVGVGAAILHMRPDVLGLAISVGALGVILFVIGQILTQRS